MAGEKTFLLAATNGDVETIKDLIAQGVNMNAVKTQGETCLHISAKNGHLSVVQWLLKEGGSKIDEKDNIGMTTLLHAVLNGHLNVVQWLFNEYGAKLDDIDNDGMNALMCAAYKGHLDIVKWLLEEGKAMVYARDYYNMSALLHAASNGHLSVVQWLLSKGGSEIDEANYFGHTALLCACRGAHLPVVRWLLLVGAGIGETLWIEREILRLIDFTSCVLIRTRINHNSITRGDAEFTHAITNAKELRQAIINHDPLNISYVYQAIIKKLHHYDDDKELKISGSLLKNLSSLRQRCIFFVVDNHIIIDDKNIKMLPEELQEEVNQALSAEKLYHC